MLTGLLGRAVLRVQQVDRGRWVDSGTCFCINIFAEETRRQFTYYATAYHVVAGHDFPVLNLRLVTSGGSIFPAEVIAYNDRAGADVALLRSTPRGDIPSLECCVGGNTPTVHLVGYPSRLQEQIIALRGESRPSLGISSQLPSLEFYCPELEAAFTRPDRRRATKVLTPHEVWRGISGAPAVAIDPITCEPLYVIGILTELAPEGIARRVRCASISVLQDLCYKKRVFLETVEPVKGVERRIRTTVGELLTGLEDPKREQIAWLQISNIFFKDRSVIHDLRSAASDPKSFGIHTSESAFVHYFLGRLFRKAGAVDQSSNEYNAALASAGSLADEGRKRLQTLIEARTLTVDPLQRRDWSAALQRIRGEIESLKGPPHEYLAMELASLIGYQATQLFLSAAEIEPEVRKGVVALAEEHERLLKFISTGKSNQEVVSTALRVFATLWESNEEGGISNHLSVLARRGFAQARANKNSIFHIQMLLTRALSRWHEGARVQAIGLAFAVGEMLASSHLTLQHEGIAHMLVYTSKNCPEFAAALRGAIVGGDTRNVLDRSIRFGAGTLGERALSEAIEVATHLRNETRRYEYYFAIDPMIYDDI